MASDTIENPKVPRTERGRKTQRKLLDAAAIEFGERGFHEASISSITRRAGVALGSFYTYFDSKDAIFRALVLDMSDAVKTAARDAIADETDPLAIERAALGGFLRFASEHKEIYRIIDEAEFVDPASYRLHYENTAKRIHARLQAGMDKAEFRDDLEEAHAWAIMGMNVFLGLRYAVWADPSEEANRKADAVADIARGILERGIGSQTGT